MCFLCGFGRFNIVSAVRHSNNNRGGVAQWVARLNRDQWILVSREFEPH